MRILAFVFLLWILCAGCGRTNLTEIPVLDWEEINACQNTLEVISEFGTDIRYIPLESRPECLINSLRDIQLTDIGFLIQDGQDRLLCFDTEGKYKWQIDRRGRGPDEYLQLVSICYNPEQREILIPVRDQILVYDAEGAYKKTVKLTGRVDQIFYLSNGYLATSSFSNSSPGIQTLTANYETVGEREFTPSPPSVGVTTSIFMPKSNEGALICSVKDTVWYTDDGMEYTALMRLKNFPTDEPLSFYLFQKKVLLIHGFTWECTLYDPVEKHILRIKGSEKNALRDDIHGGPVFYLRRENRGVLLDVMSPLSLMKVLDSVSSPELKTLGEEIKEADNPIIRLVSLDKRKKD